VYIYIYMCIHTCVYIHIYVYTYICVYTYMCIYTYVCVYLHVYMYIYMCIHTCVYVHMCYNSDWFMPSMFLCSTLVPLFQRLTSEITFSAPFFWFIGFVRFQSPFSCCLMMLLHKAASLTASLNLTFQDQQCLCCQCCLHPAWPLSNTEGTIFDFQHTALS
jgi:hypothetical protein